MKFRRGLVVGKFSPLHNGHVYLVEQARARCEQLLILSYSKPELPGCAPELRQRWLERAFPSAQCLALNDAWLQTQPAARALRLVVPENTASDAEQREFLGSVCEHVLGVAVDALFTSEDYGEGGAVALSQRFRREVTHILVDRARSVVPISATQIRADMHARRESMPAHVYASFVDRIAIVGGESSGKSTLARALADYLATEAAPEYGRERWERQRGALQYEDLLQIAQQQIAREDSACERARRYVFCDTTPYTTLFYCRDLFGRAEPELERLAGRSYALHVLCAPDFPFVQDGTRRDPAFREAQHAHYSERLTRSGEPWMLVTGDLQTRVRAVADRLANS
jgi:HTH-type transcriptional repressor of NAD biosynthesis genes